MVVKMKKYILLLVISFCIALISTTIYAKDETKILDFKKITIDADGAGGNDVIKSIDDYDRSGRVDDLSNKLIVINDQSFYYNEKTNLINIQGEETEWYLVKKGMTVYYSVDDNNLITEMLIE
jgi:hypothetical protein